MSDRSRRAFLRDLAVLPVGAGGLLAGLELLWKSPEGNGPQPADFERWAATTMTTRIDGENIYETAAGFSQAVHIGINELTLPGAVILINDSAFGAALPSSGLIHFPIDGSILLTEQDELPEATRQEIQRAKPEGVPTDGNVQVYLVGGERYISDGVREELEEMGLRVRRLNGETPAEVAARVDQYISVTEGNHADNVFIADLNNLPTALPAQSWNAHAGDGFLYVDGDRIPSETRDQLSARFGGAYMHLLGDESVISPSVARDLAQYGHVQRIPRSSDPYGLSVGFAGYKELGGNFGWWIDEEPRNFGWGVAENGHNFIFANPDAWQIAIPAMQLSHRGMHGPMLAVQQDTVPDVVETYLTELIRPHQTAPYDREYNHGFIVGGPERVSTDVQAQLHSILKEERGDAQ